MHVATIYHISIVKDIAEYFVCMLSFLLAEAETISHIDYNLLLRHPEGMTEGDFGTTRIP